MESYCSVSDTVLLPTVKAVLTISEHDLVMSFEKCFIDVKDVLLWLEQIQAVQSLRLEFDLV